MNTLYGPGPDGNNYRGEDPTEERPKDDGKDAKLVFGPRLSLN